MFPGGGPGLGLLLLRLTVGAWLWSAYAVVLFGHTIPWLCMIVICIVAALVLGLLTPLAALACALLELSHGSGGLANILPPLTAVVLALLGPGAYSLDARLFGRRVVISSSDGSG